MNPVDFDTDHDGQAGTADATSLKGIVPAWRFLVCNLLWFDLLACASTGAPPRLPYREWLDSKGMDISCVMGCQNWAMIAIGDAAALRAKADTLDVKELRSRAKAITARLWEGIDVLKSSSEVRSPNSYDIITRTNDSISQPYTTFLTT